MLACYLLCASCSERIAGKLRNQDYCLPFIHSVSLLPRGDKENKGSQTEASKIKLGSRSTVNAVCRACHSALLLTLLLEMCACVEIFHVFTTKAC